MRLISAIVAALAAGTLSTAFARPPIGRIPVDLKLVGDDGLSQNLQFQLEAGLKEDDQLRPATAQDGGSIVIESEGNVNWDKLNGRTVVIAIVYVHRSDEARGSPIVRACWEDDVKSCARAIIRVAKIRAHSIQPTSPAHPLRTLRRSITAAR